MVRAPREAGLRRLSRHPKLLWDLHAAGKTVALATSKPEGFARDILEHFGLDRYFTAICGAALDGSRDRKIDVLRYLLIQFPDRKPEETVLIGDTRFDMEGAGLAGIDGIGVLYGFGSREELERSGAKALAETAEDLRPLLLAR